MADNEYSLTKCSFYENGFCRYSNGAQEYCAHIHGIHKNRRTENFSNDVYFVPWIGLDYEKRINFGKKVMILGNSHYCKGGNLCSKMKELGICEKRREPECCHFTIDAMNDYMPYVQLASLSVISGISFDELKIDENKQEYVSKSVSYYNFVQEALKDGSAKPTKDMCKSSDKAFFEVLEKLRPELIVALGTTHMVGDVPGDEGRTPEKWEYVQPFIFQNQEFHNGFYLLDDKTKIPIIFIQHPAIRGRYDCGYWHEVVKHFALQK